MNEIAQPTHNPFRFRGDGYWDSETGFVYLRNRYMDPSLGRFITEDPARWGRNWYRYASQNPIRFADPLGLWDEDQIIMPECEQSRVNIQSVMNAQRRGFVTMERFIENLRENDAVIVPRSPDTVTVTVEPRTNNVTATVHIHFNSRGAHNQTGRDAANASGGIEDVWLGGLTFGEAAMQGFNAWNVSTDNWNMTMNIVIHDYRDHFGQNTVNVNIQHSEGPSLPGGTAAGFGSPSGITIFAMGSGWDYNYWRPWQFMQIAAHEMGHALGLSDNRQPGNIMYHQVSRTGFGGSGINIFDWHIEEILNRHNIPF